VALPSESSIKHELNLATQAFRAGDIGSAESRVDRLLAAHADRADVLLAKGIIQIGKGDLGGGLESLVASLEIAPNEPEALAWAAFTSLNVRRFGDAEKYARRLTEVQPNNPRGFYLHANALRALDRIAEGIQAIDRSLAIKPDDTDGLVTKARLLKDWNMAGLAVEFYRMALSLRPSPPAAVDLARILLNESHPDEALEVLRHVVPAMPVEQIPHALLGRAYTELQRFGEADHHWRLAEGFSNDRRGVIQERSKAEIAAGRFDVAEELLLNAIEQEEGPEAFFTILTTARKMTKDDLFLIKRMEALVVAEKVGGIQLANLNYALGKSYDDLRDFEKAIHHFDSANQICFELYPRRKNFDREAAASFTDGMIGAFTRERIEELSELGLPSEMPFFVVGMMRSGTTLTESILSAHSKVKGGGEQSFWTERAVEMFQWGQGAFEFDMGTATRFASDYLKMIDPKQDDIRYVIDKSPANFDLAAMLNCVYPNAKILHTKRHPVDNVLSIWMTPVSGNVGYASDKSNLVFAYREYIRMFKHLEQVLAPDRFATVNYEELTSNPEETIRSMLQFAQLEPEPACFTPEQNRRTVLTPSVHQVRQAIHTGAQERWKNYEPWLGAFADLLEDV
jgi:tetratricopeptide (TPR) repeat protein